MTKLDTGDKAPDFTIPTDGGGTFTLSDHRGGKVIIFFYPKDNTPGCTKESCAFRDNLDELNDLGATVIGISKDSVKSHDKFKDKYNLNFPLGSDETGDVCEQYGVWVKKNMYGRKYMGIQRATFLVDEDGHIENIWPKVRVKGHVEDVKETLKKNVKAA